MGDSAERALPREREMARLTLLISPELKRALDRACAAQDLTTSQVVRSLIADYVARHSRPSRAVAGG